MKSGFFDFLYKYIRHIWMTMVTLNGHSHKIYILCVLIMCFSTNKIYRPNLFQGYNRLAGRLSGSAVTFGWIWLKWLFLADFDPGHFRPGPQFWTSVLESIILCTLDLCLNCYILKYYHIHFVQKHMGLCINKGWFNQILLTTLPGRV